MRRAFWRAFCAINEWPEPNKLQVGSVHLAVHLAVHLHAFSKRLESSSGTPPQSIAGALGCPLTENDVAQWIACKWTGGESSPGMVVNTSPGEWRMHLRASDEIEFRQVVNTSPGEWRMHLRASDEIDFRQVVNTSPGEWRMHLRASDEIVFVMVSFSVSVKEHLLPRDLINLVICMHFCVRFSTK